MIKTQYVNSFSEKGIRENNEDFIAPSISSLEDRYFIVCDGMGGHKNGEIASQTVAESLNKYFSVLSVPVEGCYIQDGIGYATDQLSHKDIYNDDKRKMGTTVVLAVITKSSILVGHVGDSRLYHIRPNEGLMFRTKDHSQVQEWIDAEIISEVEAREHPKKNIITRSVHSNPTNPILIEIDELKDLRTEDYLFLCTDGVMDAMTDEEIVKIIANDTITDEEKIDKVKMICANYSHDNYSGFLLKIETDIILNICPSCLDINELSNEFCANCGKKLILKKGKSSNSIKNWFLNIFSTIKKLITKESRK